MKDDSRAYAVFGIVKDNSGSYAVFTEQGSSASQMTAAKVMDVIARLPDWDGRAADAVSAYTQVKMEDAPRLLRIPKSECPDVWIRLPRHKRPKSCVDIEEPVVPLGRNLYGQQDGKKYRIENAFSFVHRTRELFFSVYVDDKNDWKKAELQSYVEEIDEAG